MAKNKKKYEFSKFLLIQESILVWITTIAFIVLAFLSIEKDYIGELTWLAALCSALWAAYGVSQAFYYNKAKHENCGGENSVRYLYAKKELGIEPEEVKEDENEEEPLG